MPVAARTLFDARFAWIGRRDLYFPARKESQMNTRKRDEWWRTEIAELRQALNGLAPKMARLGMVLGDAKTLGAAKMAVAAFNAGSPELSYMDKVGLTAMQKIVEGQKDSRELKSAKESAGFLGGYDKPHEILCVLAQGWAHFNEKAIKGLAAWWASLANRGDSVPLPNTENGTMNFETMRAWASATLGAAREAEHDDRPIASCNAENGVVRLTWVGTWTRGRFVEMEFYFGEDGTPAGAWMCWDTGTGAPSTYLRVERFLAPESCTDFGETENADNAVTNPAPAA